MILWLFTITYYYLYFCRCCCYGGSHYVSNCVCCSISITIAIMVVTSHHCQHCQRGRWWLQQWRKRWARRRCPSLSTALWSNWGRPLSAQSWAIRTTPSSQQKVKFTKFASLVVGINWPLVFISVLDNQNYAFIATIDESTFHVVDIYYSLVLLSAWDHQKYAFIEKWAKLTFFNCHSYLPTASLTSALENQNYTFNGKWVQFYLSLSSLILDRPKHFPYVWPGQSELRCFIPTLSET